jgi:hypothetical protein
MWGTGRKLNKKHKTRCEGNGTKRKEMQTLKTRFLFLIQMCTPGGSEQALHLVAPFLSHETQDVHVAYFASSNRSRR